jgi:hypothetical protein
MLDGTKTMLRKKKNKNENKMLDIFEIHYTVMTVLCYICQSLALTCVIRR